MSGAVVLPSDSDVTEAGKMITKAKRPIIIMGHGAVEAREDIIALAEGLGAGVHALRDAAAVIVVTPRRTGLTAAGAEKMREGKNKLSVTSASSAEVPADVAALEPPAVSSAAAVCVSVPSKKRAWKMTFLPMVRLASFIAASHRYWFNVSQMHVGSCLSEGRLFYQQHVVQK